MSNRLRTRQGQGVAEPFPIPAPMMGLNTLADYTLLQPTEARVLENWLPDEGACKVRPGYLAHQAVSGATSIPTMMVWEGATGRKLIASASDGELYDVGGTPSAITSSAAYSDNLWSWDNFNGYLFGVNGTDTPWRFDGGSAVAATGFTGPTLTSLQTVTQVRDRLWFTLINSADVYYGGVGAVTGALTAFQLSQIAPGGKALDVGAWSRDAGDGADDFTVFVMSTGWVIVYQGNPATNFSLVGKYQAPPPVGPDCTIQVGGELVILTVSGPVPVSAIIAGNAYRPEALGYWGKIAPSWAKDYTLYGGNAGWNASFINGLVYFVIPTGSTSNKIYVLNTRNSAWTVYTKIPATMFVEFSGSIYFGGSVSDDVWRHAGGSDAGVSIETVARQGWTYPTGGRRAMQYTMMKPLITPSASCQAQFQVDTDFQAFPITAALETINAESEGANWDEEDWDDPDWADEPRSDNLWYSIRGKGSSVAPVVKTYSVSDTVEWSATHIMAVPAGRL